MLEDLKTKTFRSQSARRPRESPSSPALLFVTVSTSEACASARKVKASAGGKGRLMSESFSRGQSRQHSRRDSDDSEGSLGRP